MRPKVIEEYPEELDFKNGKREELSDFEIKFLGKLKEKSLFLLHKLNRNDIPYEGTDYESDFVLILPEGSLYKGVSIELQGGIIQGSNSKTGKRGHRTGHASVPGLRRDYRKAIACQLNGFMFMPIANFDSDINFAIVTLINLYMNSLEDSFEL